MIRKRLLCAALLLALLFSAQTAAAADAGNVRTMIIESTCRTPIIDVEVPTTGEVYINPLNLPVEMGMDTEAGQIFSAPMALANYSDVALQVDVRVRGSVYRGSDLTLAATSTKNSASTAKRAFVYFEILSADTDNPDDVRWEPAYDSTKHIAVTTTAKTKENILTLSAMTPEGEVAPGGYAQFRLTGDAVKLPTNPWTEEDGIDVEIAFTFTPIAFES